MKARHDQGLIAKSSVPHATPAGAIWRRIQSGLLGNHKTAAMSLVGAFAPCSHPKLISLVPSDLLLISDTTATNQDSRHSDVSSCWLMVRVYAVFVMDGFAPFPWKVMYCSRSIHSSDTAAKRRIPVAS